MLISKIKKMNISHINSAHLLDSNYNKTKIDSVIY